MTTPTDVPVVTTTTAVQRRRWGFSLRTEAADPIHAQLHSPDEPTRAGLLSLDQLCHHAQMLARRHELAARPGRDRLLARLRENARILQRTHDLLRRAAAERGSLSPAGVWFLDNYYLIQEQIRLARRHLPRKYSTELPQLAGVVSLGLPRVYDLALELISHADGQIDGENLFQFVEAYQRVEPLAIGEAWAIPIMLRLALIENLRQAALRIVWRQHGQESGQSWAEHLLRVWRTSPADFPQAVGQMIAARPALNSAFVASFTQGLGGQLPKDNAAVRWLTQELTQRGQAMEELLNLDSQSQAGDQVSISNSISSLRAMGAIDWKEFVERLSIVEHVLRQDPAQVYPRMSFDSRDRYRHVVEKLARRSHLSQQQVARVAIEHARKAAAAGSAERQLPEDLLRQQHVGYYLVDRGRSLLEESIGYRYTGLDVFVRPWMQAPMVTYVGAILVVWLVAVAGAASVASWLGAIRLVNPGVVLLLLALFAGAAAQFAVNVVNWLTMLIVPPRPIMRMDFSDGIPRVYRTLVVIPTMMTDESGVRTLVEQLEVRYLANQDENLLFALMTDFPDAPQETLPTDQRLLEVARQQIRQLNVHYRGSRPSVFYLLHRPRKFNPQEGVWMGEERKRGKLASLNRLLRTGVSEDFQVTEGDLSQLAGVRFVITLDTDTRLPRDVGRELVGCMAHPLNRPQVDPSTHLAVEGYGVLQPRVTTMMPEASRSRFSRLFAGDAGLDPYTLQASDLYQDVFGRGSFIGKGIYDVQAFETALEDRFPDNRVLSHDLIEGNFTGSGLINDVEVFEGFPSTFLADMSRRHRWIRGDWQIAAWLRPWVPSARGLQRNPLGALARWKIFDNLRRSLTPIMLLAFLALAWTLAPALAIYWTLLVVLLVFGPTVASCAPGYLRKPEEKPWSLHLKDQGSNCVKALAREAIGLCVLPYTVHCHIDAIARTIYRLHVSREKLLEWTTASDAEVRSQGNARDYYEVMWACPVAGMALAAALMVLHPVALAAASPVLLAWLLGPAVAWEISRVRAAEPVPLSPDRKRQLRRWARQTWHYFDTYVDHQSHWLAPDNVREHSTWVADIRTSPTNIGMGLLANLAAYDLGYLPAGELLARSQHTLETLSRLDRYRGHFYNWYDTHTLLPCEPRYVSSVDSGNLWAALLVLRCGLKELGDRPLVSPRWMDGLCDTLEVIASLGASMGPAMRSEPFDTRLASLREECHDALQGGPRWAWQWLGRVEAAAQELAAAVPAKASALDQWCQALLRQCAAARQDLRQLAFWVETIPLDSSALPSLPQLEPEIRQLNQQLERLDTACSLRRLPELARQVVTRATALLRAMEAYNGAPALASLRTQLSSLLQSAEESAVAAREELRRLNVLAELCQQLSEMDFRFLFHSGRRLLAIGYSVSERRRDNSYYDLLASESRLTSFLAISARQLPRDHWFALGRMMTITDGEPTLLSWSGSMFEYLMPMLLMPSYPGTLLDASCRAAVRRQIRYGHRQGVPWGISESCYNVTDASLSYQYRAFGVPGLGLDRGLGDHLVVAPYASALAAMLAPREACANLGQLERLGYLSPYGFYDAIDYTPERRLAADQPAPCRTVMAHHSGMTLLAMVHVLLDQPMQRRLLADPCLKAHDLLLQERLSQAVRPVDPETLDPGPVLHDAARSSHDRVRVYDKPHTAAPETHVLGNGRYQVVLTGTGTGMSRWARLAVTRFHEDFPGGRFGQFCYLRDLETGSCWSNTYEPTLQAGEICQAVFSQGQAEYRVANEEIDARTQVSVSPEDDVEVRKLTLTNFSHLKRTIELTTYAEVALVDPERHPTLENTLVQTETLHEGAAIICARRSTAADEKPVWLFHLLHVQTPSAGPASAETSRQRFLGPEGTLEHPAALQTAGPLSGGQPAVPDPILSIRRALVLESEESTVAYLITGVAESREEACQALAHYRDVRLADRVFELSRAHCQLTSRLDPPHITPRARLCTRGK